MEKHGRSRQSVMHLMLTMILIDRDGKIRDRPTGNCSCCVTASIDTVLLEGIFVAETRRSELSYIAGEYLRVAVIFLGLVLISHFCVS